MKVILEDGSVENYSIFVAVDPYVSLTEAEAARALSSSGRTFRGFGHYSPDAESKDEPPKGIFAKHACVKTVFLSVAGKKNYSSVDPARILEAQAKSFESGNILDLRPLAAG